MEMLTYPCSLVSVLATRSESGDGHVSIAEKAKEAYEREFKARLAEDEAILADGSKVALETFVLRSAKRLPLQSLARPP